MDKVKIHSHWLPSVALQDYGIIVKRGKSTFISRAKGCPFWTEKMDDSYIIFFEMFDKDWTFIGQPWIEIGLKTDRESADGLYSGFYAIREMDEGGIWGETCMSFHKIMAIANEHTTSVLGNLAVTLLEEYEKCHGITRELLITDDSDTLQGVVAWYCMEFVRGDERKQLHVDWVKRIREAEATT